MFLKRKLGVTTRDPLNVSHCITFFSYSSLTNLSSVVIPTHFVKMQLFSVQFISLSQVLMCNRSSIYSPWKRGKRGEGKWRCRSDHEGGEVAATSWALMSIEGGLACRNGLESRNREEEYYYL